MGWLVEVVQKKSVLFDLAERFGSGIAALAFEDDDLGACEEDCVESALFARNGELKEKLPVAGGLVGRGEFVERVSEIYEVAPPGQGLIGVHLGKARIGISKSEFCENFTVFGVEKMCNC
jgi:hypothetical protein